MSLPSGWAATSLGELAELIRGVTYRKEDAQSAPAAGLIPLARATNIQSGRLDRHALVFVPANYVASRQYLRAGDIVVATSSGSKAVVGKAAAAAREHTDMSFGAFCGVIRPSDPRTKDWIRWVFETNEYRAFVESVAIGTNINNLRSRDLESYPVFLPPTAEQRRIVAKLDAQAARLAQARAEARRVHELADKLRRGTLHQAFSGALTHSQAHAGERGSTALPEEWTLQELGQISDIQGGIQVGKKRQGAAPLIETFYLRVANVQRGWLKLDEIKTIGVTAEERARLLLQPGDILMNEGGDRDKLGRGWVWQGQVADCIHQNHVFRIRLHDREFPPEFISHYANEFGQQYFIDEGTQTTNLASISKRKVAALPVPLPPVEEARRITKLITDAFARADRLEAEAKKALALIDRLEAAILAKAFRGELVPQDPNDEPASVLLERIRARRAAEPKAKRGRRPKLAS